MSEEADLYQHVPHKRSILLRQAVSKVAQEDLWLSMGITFV